MNKYMLFKIWTLLRFYDKKKTTILENGSNDFEQNNGLEFFGISKSIYQGVIT